MDIERALQVSNESVLGNETCSPLIYKFEIVDAASDVLEIMQSKTFTLSTVFPVALNEFCAMQFARGFLSELLSKSEKVDYCNDYQDYNVFTDTDGKNLFTVNFHGVVDQKDSLHFDCASPTFFVSDFLLQKVDNIDDGYAYMDCIVLNLPFKDSQDYDHDVRICLSCEYSLLENKLKKIEVDSFSKNIECLFSSQVFIDAISDKFMENLLKLDESRFPDHMSF